jgi:hypothetical protein
MSLLSYRDSGDASIAVDGVLLQFGAGCTSSQQGGGQEISEGTIAWPGGNLSAEDPRAVAQQLVTRSAAALGCDL